MVKRPAITWIGAHPNNTYPSRFGHKAVAIVCHIAEGTLGSVDSWFNNPQSGASTNFCIGPAGEIHQYVELDKAPHANGRIEDGATWWGITKYPGVNPNYLTISIETAGKHPNMGAGQYYTPTDAQVQAYIHLIAWLCWETAIPCDRDHIIGHFEISPKSRAYCPGPHFPFDTIIAGARKLLVEGVAGMFADMENHWAKDSVERLAKMQVPGGGTFIQGRQQADGSVLFEPDQPMTRAETVVLFDRLLKILGK
jgi:N-acetyl-anhydromuramyl-L-alanine amidase AmpD